MKKISRKAKNRKTHLPLLVQADSKETGGAVKFTEFNLNDFAKRLEQALLEQPNFQPPYTTTDMPACIVGYKVYPNLPPAGGFTIFMDILPGDKVPQYYEEILKKLGAVPESDNGASAKRQKT